MLGNVSFVNFSHAGVLVCKDLEELKVMNDTRLLIAQLHEWAEIEDEYDLLPEHIICPHEMNEDMDNWQDKGDQKEELLAIQARSPLPGGTYLIPVQVDHRDGYFGRLQGEWPTGWENTVEENATFPYTGRDQDGFDPFCSQLILSETRPQRHAPGVNQETRSFDSGEKIIVEATITRNGMKYHAGQCSSGNIYIDLKFTSHIPSIGEKVRMIVRLKGPGNAYTWKCAKVLKNK
jgi:hypothetical protein